MIELLEKYKSKGHFEFTPFDSLEQKCNAPTDKGGVYLIYEIRNNYRRLIYVGSSGQRNADGSLKIRQSGLGGMKDRIVNGYHPGYRKVERKKAWPEMMRIQKIEKIVVYWWVTFDSEFKDFPTDVEKMILNNYILKYGSKPKWHS
jgi:hypothetical protein